METYEKGLARIIGELQNMRLSQIAFRENLLMACNDSKDYHEFYNRVAGALCFRYPEIAKELRPNPASPRFLVKDINTAEVEENP